MRTLYAALALAILASVSQASPEVESLGLEREGMALIQEEEQPNQKVVDLTSKIKNLQKDIQDIRSKKSAAMSDAAGAESLARSSDGAEQDAHMKKSISHRAAVADLDAAEKSKSAEIVDLTLAQHDAAKDAAIDSTSQKGTRSKGGGSESDSSSSDSSSSNYYDSSSSFDSNGGYGGDVDTSSQSGALFDEWLAKWGGMRSKLNRMVSPLIAEVKVQHDEVNSHMEVVRKAYEKEHSGRVKAIAKAKEFNTKEGHAKSAEKKAKAAEADAKRKMQEAAHKAKERQSKAVEVKQKQVVEQTRLKEHFERKVKAIHPDKCGPVKEQEQKAKAEIKRLQAENQKIRESCEQKAKEMKNKSDERLTKAKEKTAKETARADRLAQLLSAAKEKIASLTSQLAAAKAKIRSLTHELAVSREETAKQKALKEAAEAKVADLTAQLAAMTAKYHKLKSTMSHINEVSNTPDRRSN